MNLVQLPSLENGLKCSTKMMQCNQHVGRIWDLRQSVTYCNSVPSPSNSQPIPVSPRVSPISRQASNPASLMTGLLGHRKPDTTTPLNASLKIENANKGGPFIIPFRYAILRMHGLEGEQTEYFRSRSEMMVSLAGRRKVNR